MRSYDYDIAVIGAGPGGLVVAIGAAKAGKKVALIDKGTWGGDCTNFGCVPSKSLIAAADAAHIVREHKQYGLSFTLSPIDAKGALARARSIVASIRKEEEPEALAKKGVDAITGIASFLDPHTIEVENAEGQVRRVAADQIVIATGTHPRVPEIAGLRDIDFLTNETLFTLEKIPESLVVLGGGPIGSEMAQAFRRLGSEVTIVQFADRLLTREDPEVGHTLKELFAKEGIEVLIQHKAMSVRKTKEQIIVNIEDEKGKSKEAACSHLLVAAGRLPNTHKLHLLHAGVKQTTNGFIEVDAYGCSSQKHIFAIGDVNGWWLFTHAAENEARTVLANLLLPWLLRRKLDRAQAMPRVTYTDPEVAQVGLREVDAIKSYGPRRVTSYRVDFTQVDRARVCQKTNGFLKLITKKWSGRILGATIVGPHAGELLSELSLAVQKKLSARDLSTLIHPYPTFSMAVRTAADGWLQKTIFPPLAKWLGFNKKNQ